MSLMNYAPRLPTIIVALALDLVGLLGTFGSVLPDAVGVWAFLLAAAALIIGMVVEGL
jgi:hypothetical protein